MSSARDLRRVEALLNPASPGLAPGADLRAEPRYVALKDEVSKLDSTSGGPVDWGKVTSAGSQVLTHVAKDLQTAAYVAFGFFQLGGLWGLSEGLTLLAELVDKHWESMLPPPTRVRGRVNAIAWFVERSAQHLSELTEVDPPAVVAARSVLDRLKTSAAAKFGGEAPSLAALEGGLARAATLAGSGESPPRPPPEASPPPAAPQPVAVATAAAAPAPAASDPWERAKARADRWLKPIAGDAPGGTAAKLDPRFEQIRLEVAKLEAVSGASPDWGLVAKEASAILETTSKDLLVASYLACALGMTEGLKGWVDGVALLARLTDEFWATAFPEVTRLRGRANAVGWYAERAQAQWLLLELKVADRPDAELLVAACRRLSAVVGERFGDDGPSMRGLIGTADRVLMSVPIPEAPAPAPAAKAPSAAGPSAPTASGPKLPEAPAAKLEGPAQVGAFLSKIGPTLAEAGKQLRGADRRDPTAYRLLRNGLWLHILAAPPATNGKTTVPGPPPELKKKLELMSANQKWDALLDEAEGALTQHRLYLDLNGYTDRALAGLGAELVPARAAVRSSVAELVARLPGITELAFADGTPFSGPDGRTYLAAIAPAAGGPVAPAPAPAEAGAETGEEAAGEARFRELLQGGKAGAAMAELERAARSAKDGATRFRLRLTGAELLLASGAAVLSRAIFEDLDGEVQRRGLEEWAPGLASACLSGYIRAIRGKDGKGVPPEAAPLYRRLARVDPEAALRLSS